MRRKMLIPLLLLLTLWAGPLRAAEPGRTVTLLSFRGVALEVPYPEGYTSAPEGSPEFTSMNEHMRTMVPMLRVVGVFLPEAPEAVPGKILVICGYETEIKMTPISFQAMKGVFKNMNWAADIRRAAEAAGRPDPLSDPAMVGVFAEGDTYVAAATLAPPNQGGGPFIATITLTTILEEKPVTFYFCEPMGSEAVLPALKEETLRYLKALEDTGRLGFSTTSGS